MTSTHLNSDHPKVSFNIDTLISNPAKNPIIYFFEGNYYNLCNTLLQVDFTPCLFSQDTKFVWNFIKSEIVKAVLLHIPTTRLYSHQFPKWFTPSIHHQVKCMRTLRRKCSQSPTLLNLSKLEELQEALYNEIIIAKSDYEFNLIGNMSNTNSTKVFWHKIPYIAFYSW